MSTRVERSAAAAKPCEKCGRIVADHKLSEILFCVYEGMPLKNGGAFNKGTAREVVDGVRKRLLS